MSMLDPRYTRQLMYDLTRAPSTYAQEHPNTFGSMSPYQPTRVERMRNAITDTTGSKGLADVAEYVSPLGLAAYTMDEGQAAAEAAQAGDYKGAGQHLQYAAMGLMPGGKLAKPVKAGVNVVEDAVLRANKTARAAGAVGAKAITPRYVADTVQHGDTVLNFGAGKPGPGGTYQHSDMIREKGGQVAEYDFGNNAVGAIEPSNTVFASNVLNVQSSPEMMRKTLEEIKSATQGRAVFNLPQSPRLNNMTNDEVEAMVTDVFGFAPTRVGGTKAAPLWEVRMQSAAAPLGRTPEAAGGNMRAMQLLPERPQPLPAGASGSYDPTANVDFTWQGKQPHEFTGEDFQAVGEAFGVPRLGPNTPDVELPYATGGGSFMLPGGTEGKFTYADMMNIKANSPDPSRIDPAMHAAIQQKMTRSLMPDEDIGATDAQIWNGLVFGATSPNNPLTANQLGMSRLRVNSMDDLNRIADATPWDIENMSKVTPEQRKQASDAIAAQFGLASAEKGGLGVRGTADYSRVSDMAKMFRKNPQFFRRRDNEPWHQFVERVVTQTPGLSAKTGSFGVVWQDPAHAAISAIDRHMVRRFEKEQGQIFTPEKRKKFEDRVLNLYNKKRIKEGKQPYADITEMNDGDIGYELLQEMGKAKRGAFRDAKGNISKNVPEHLAKEDWVVEPEQFMQIGENYKRALEVNAEQAREHGLGLFESQWHVWDRQRRRLEPHENMFPGLERIPRMSKQQLDVANAAHRETGHKSGTKETDELTGDFRMKPTKRIANPSRLTYFGLAPFALAPGLLPPDER